MSEAALPLETARSFSPPTVTQFSVFLSNRVGRLFDLVESFEEKGSDICAISVHEASDHAVVRLVTNNADIAREILTEMKLPYSDRDVLLVEMINDHSLSSLCLSLLAAELNIHFAYPLMRRPNGTPTIALAVDDITLAGQILRRKMFRLYGEADLPKSM